MNYDCKRSFVPPFEESFKNAVQTELQTGRRIFFATCSSRGERARDQCRNESVTALVQRHRPLVMRENSSSAIFFFFSCITFVR